MSQMIGRSSRSPLVTLVGVVNLVFGGLFVAFGVYCLVEGADAVATLFQIKQDAAQAGVNAGVSVSAADARQLGDFADLGAKGLGGVILAMVSVVAGCSMVQGAPLLLVGLGVLLRWQWARILALIFAVLAGLEGLACLTSAAQGNAFLVSGIVLLAYALLSIIGLLGRGAYADFSRRSEPQEAQRGSDRLFGGETVAAAEPPPSPPLSRRPLAVPIMGGVLAVTIITVVVILYIQFASPAQHTGATAQSKSTASAPHAPPPAWLPGLMAAAEAGQLSGILAAAAKGPVDEKNEQGETALMKAAAQGNLAASALLLELGAQVNEHDGKGQTPLMLAAMHGDGALVDLFLGNEAGGVNMEAVRQQALLAAPPDLDKAAKDPSKGLSIQLPSLGTFKPPKAEVDASDAEGQTAFMKAVLKGHHDVARTLIQQGAKGPMTDHQGNNVLHLAAQKADSDVLKHFKMHSVDQVNGSGAQRYYMPDLDSDASAVKIVDTPNNSGMLPWMLAAAGGRLEAVKLLLPADAPKETVNQKNKEGKTALELAAANGHQDVVDYLKPLAGVDVAVVVAPPAPAPGPKEPSPLMKAVDAGDLDMVQSLLAAAPISADDQDEDGKTVLIHAAAKGDAKMVLLLTAAAGKTLGADYLERKDKEGRTALIHAAAAGHAAAVEALLVAVSAEWDRGRLNWFTPLSCSDKSGKSALEQAEAKSDKATVDLLRAYVNHNLDVRSTTNGRTALEDMCDSGDLPGVQALMKSWANKAPPAQNLSALALAAAKGNTRIVQALLDSFGEDKAGRQKYVALVVTLPIPGAEGRPVTALLMAVEKGHIVVVQQLLDAFGDDKEGRKAYLQVTATSVDPNTGVPDAVPALTVANRLNHKEIAAMLKKYGAAP